MSILTAMGLAHLQTLQHVLQEMEAEKVPDLPTARLRVAAEISRQHGERMSRRSMARKNIKQPRDAEMCLACGIPMSAIPNADPDSNEQITVLQCKKCRFSKMMEK